MLLFKMFGAFIATVAFSYLWSTPRRFIIQAGVVGALGCGLYLVLTEAGFSTGTATFFAGCLVSLCAQILARILKTPVTMFVIPGILPLVPGTGMYNIVYSMSHTMEYTTAHYITETLTIAGMIAVSIVVMESLFRILPKRAGRTNTGAGD